MCGYFLSRLCVGEFYMGRPKEIADFLSRLCGGEYNRWYQDAKTKFLSRLCGGEYWYTKPSSDELVSKPPMWR